MTTYPRLHSTMVGDAGPVVVFCHGLFGRGRNWQGIAKGLRPDYRCLLVDLPNHGSSDWTETIDYALFAELLAEHLRTGVASDGPVAVVGHSMGGKIVMMLALLHPHLVERLVVVDISPTGSGEVGEFAHLLGALARMDLDVLASLGDADRQLAQEVPQPRLRGFLLQNLRRDRETGEFAWQPNLELLRRELPTITADIPHGDRSYPGPVLWVGGARSDYVQPARNEPQMRALFPATRRVTVKDAGHWVHSEQPQIFASVLRHFLDAGAQRPGAETLHTS